MIITPGGNISRNHENKNTVVDFKGDYEKEQVNLI